MSYDIVSRSFEFFSLLLVLVIQHVILVSEMCRFKCILFHLSLELSDYHNWCKMPDYKYWTPTLFKKFTVLEKMGCWSLDLLPLDKFYDHVCSAVILISLTLIINRRTAVISLNALWPLVFERSFSYVSFSYVSFSYVSFSYVSFSYVSFRRVSALTAISSHG